MKRPQRLAAYWFTPYGLPKDAPPPPHTHNELGPSSLGTELEFSARASVLLTTGLSVQFPLCELKEIFL